IFPADVGDAKGLFASRRRVAAHIFVIHTIVAEIGAIAGRSDELGHVALGNPCTVAAVCGFQDLMAFAGFFSSAVTLATGEQRIMNATLPSARPRCLQSSENLEASCSLSLVWSCRSDRTCYSCGA